MKIDHALKLLAVLQLVSLLAFTVTCYGQSRNVTDAVQDQRLVWVEREAMNNTERISLLITELSSLRSSMERFIGIGIGLGVALTALQGIQVILQIKKKT